MNTTQKIEQLQKELDKLKKETQNFEHGDWVVITQQRHTQNGGVGRLIKDNYSGLCDWGFVRPDGTSQDGFDNGYFRQATIDEIFQTLDKERKRRYENYTHYRSLDENDGIIGTSVGNPTYSYQNDTLYFNGGVCYRKGEWAEPVKQNKIYDYTVEHKGGKFYKIGCEDSIEIKFLEQLATLTKKHDIKIVLEGHDVTNDIQNLNL